MIVITAATGDMKDLVIGQAKRVYSFEYDHRIFDFGGLGFGIPYRVDPLDIAPVPGIHAPRCLFKIDLLLSCFEENNTLCWLDADCLPLKEFEIDGAFDAAVTLRPSSEIGKSGMFNHDYINAGVIWIRSRKFLDHWRQRSVIHQNDQGGLNDLIGEGMSVEEWRKSMNSTIITKHDGFKVRILNAMKWNCWHIPPVEDTRIMHFKKGIRRAASNYL